MEVYVFEKEKTRAFRMERRKYYEQNKKVVEEITKIGNDRQVQAGYSARFHYPHLDHLWADAGKDHELTCVTWLYCEESGNEKDYLFVGEFGTPSTILAPKFQVKEGSYVNNNLEALVAEIKKGLQRYTFYGTTTKPWFYTFEEREALPPIDMSQAVENATELMDSLKNDPGFLEYSRQVAGQEAVDELLTWQPPAQEENQIIQVTQRGLTPEERQEFIRIYNS